MSDPSEMEEPVECNCGEWVELQSAIQCRLCNYLGCMSCLKHGLCEICDQEICDEEGV